MRLKLRIHPANDRHEAIELVQIANAVTTRVDVDCTKGNWALRHADLAIGIKFVEGSPEEGEVSPEFWRVDILSRKRLVVPLQRLDVAVGVPPL